VLNKDGSIFASKCVFLTFFRILSIYLKLIERLKLNILSPIGEILTILVMERGDWTVCDVRKVELAPLFRHLGVFLAEKPAEVGEKKSAPYVVGICFRFAEFVVHPVVPHPLDYPHLHTTTNQELHKNLF